MNSPLVAIDANILVRGMVASWGSAKGLLILARHRRFRLLLVQTVEAEARRALRTRDHDADALDVTLGPCLVERVPDPQPADILARRGLLSRIRHLNDLSIAVAVDLAQPDFFLSDNTAHFNAAFGDHIGVRVLTSSDFLDLLLDTAIPNLVPPA